MAKRQKPFAILLSCSDSRVVPELVFDQRLGDLFVVRVAGNIADPVVLGSLEYAAEHFGSPLILVLGHQSCGAVTAAVEAKGPVPGNVGAILETIAPVVAKAGSIAARRKGWWNAPSGRTSDGCGCRWWTARRCWPGWSGKASC